MQQPETALTGLSYGNATYALLWVILTAVLALPFAVHRVERNLELFLLVMGTVATTISGLWSPALLAEALREPIAITLVVLAAGLLFHYGRKAVERGFRALRARVPLRLLVFLIVVGLGLLSSLVTAIIASLLLVEAINLLNLDRHIEERLTILTCFSIGLGAALTPIGEPLSTIVTGKLHGDFWLLARLLGPWILPGVLVLGCFAALLHPRQDSDTLKDARPHEDLSEVWIRTVKVFAFVAALVLLGTGLTPLVDRFVLRLPAALLFWVNMISAILDNATLAAAEISVAMSRDQVTAALLGLLVSGGMLIPGNIPNIVAAGHLKITSRAWAKIGVPVGLIMMGLTFGVWLALRS
jgi:predicted cation transporter